jgi:hypothetical protein
MNDKDPDGKAIVKERAELAKEQCRAPASPTNS